VVSYPSGDVRFNKDVHKTAGRVVCTMPPQPVEGSHRPAGRQAEEVVVARPVPSGEEGVRAPPAAQPADVGVPESRSPVEVGELETEPDRELQEAKPTGDPQEQQEPDVELGDDQLEVALSLNGSAELVEEEDTAVRPGSALEKASPVIRDVSLSEGGNPIRSPCQLRKKVMEVLNEQDEDVTGDLSIMISQEDALHLLADVAGTADREPDLPMGPDDTLESSESELYRLVYEEPPGCSLLDTPAGAEMVVARRKKMKKKRESRSKGGRGL